MNKIKAKEFISVLMIFVISFIFHTCSRTIDISDSIRKSDYAGKTSSILMLVKIKKGGFLSGDWAQLTFFNGSHQTLEFNSMMDKYYYYIGSKSFTARIMTDFLIYPIYLEPQKYTNVAISIPDKSKNNIDIFVVQLGMHNIQIIARKIGE